MSQEQKVDHRKMKMEVEKLEIQARYWKANFELKYYTIQDSKIGKEYFDLVDEVKKAGLIPEEGLKLSPEEEPTSNDLEEVDNG